MRIPRAEARPQPTIIATGVARPMAHGQATSRTAIALSTAVPEVRADQPPAEKGRGGHQQHDGHEDRADAVGEPFERGLGAQGIVHHLLEPGQDRFGGDGAHLDDEDAVPVARARGDVAPGSVLDRQGLTGQHRLVHRGPAHDDLAVQRDRLSGHDPHLSPDRDRLGRDDPVLIVRVRGPGRAAPSAG